ncbi:MAG: LysE family transporter [Verrucomicrobiae bacterium]|nr:LysE family transporter [Verrucomicrobiae bacterium]
MGEVPHIFIAWLTGFIAGFVASFVPGPINVAIINQGARQGFKWAIMIGLGSTVMEVVYCAIAFAGFSAMFSQRVIKAVLEVVSFLLMIYLGFKYLRAKAIEDHNPSADRIEQKLHPHSAFAIGFVQVLGNPGVLLMWIALTASFVAHEWVEPTWEEKLACLAGVAVGALVWFVGLSYAISRKHRTLSQQTLLWMEHLSGVLLLLIAVILGARIVLLLSAH